MKPRQAKTTTAIASDLNPRRGLVELIIVLLMSAGGSPARIEPLTARA
jgi:hypothetical protein